MEAGMKFSMYKREGANEDDLENIKTYMSAVKA